MRLVIDGHDLLALRQRRDDGRRSQVRVDSLFEQLERQRACTEYGGVEVADVELVTERLLRLVAQLEQLQLAHHVRARLARVDDVALDLARFDSVVNRLLPRPVLRVNAGVDDEAARAKQLGVQLAKQTDGIVLVPVGLRRETLRIETPAFAQRRNAAERAHSPELRLRSVFEFERDL